MERCYVIIEAEGRYGASLMISDAAQRAGSNQRKFNVHGWTSKTGGHLQYKIDRDYWRPDARADEDLERIKETLRSEPWLHDGTGWAVLSFVEERGAHYVQAILSSREAAEAYAISSYPARWIAQVSWAEQSWGPILDPDPSRRGQRAEKVLAEARFYHPRHRRGNPAVV